MKPYARVITIGAISFGLNGVWEYLHLPLYTGYEQLGSGFPLIMWATAGDAMYTILIVLFVALCKRDVLWFEKARMAEYVLLGVLGCATAMFIEYKALVLHRWAYTNAMPTLFGVGLSPLLQLTLLVPVAVLLSNYIYRRAR